MYMETAAPASSPGGEEDRQTIQSGYLAPRVLHRLPARFELSLRLDKTIV